MDCGRASPLSIPFSSTPCISPFNHPDITPPLSTLHVDRYVLYLRRNAIISFLMETSAMLSNLPALQLRVPCLLSYRSNANCVASTWIQDSSNEMSPRVVRLTHFLAETSCQDSSLRGFCNLSMHAILPTVCSLSCRWPIPLFTFGGNVHNSRFHNIHFHTDL